MWSHSDVLRVLRARGELWDVAPGVTGLRGDAGALFNALERRIADVCLAETSDDWRVPPAIDFATLARAEYFASLPQWLTLASHLSGDEVLQQLAEHPEPAIAVRQMSTMPAVALNPAVCYHVYAAFAGQVIGTRKLITAQAGCWRHEGARHESLERGWAFTMREVVCIGSESDARDFLRRSTECASQLANALGIEATIARATDPFFAPTARAKQLLQQMKELKHELLLPIGANRTTAAASFNLHDTFFGEAFDIHLADGRPATTACLAFGIERWTLAFLTAHGPDASRWPSTTAVEKQVLRSLRSHQDDIPPLPSPVPR
jgi:seryl-tRNA synthetase